MKRVSLVALSCLFLSFAQATNIPQNDPKLAKQLSIEVLDEIELNIDGGYCDFSSESGTILKGDWGNRLWMKIDGRLTEFQGKRSPGDDLTDVQNKRWRQTFKSEDMALILDLIQTHEGDSSVAMKGTITLKAKDIEKKVKVKGGCGS